MSISGYVCLYLDIRFYHFLDDSVFEFHFCRGSVVHQPGLFFAVPAGARGLDAVSEFGFFELYFNQYHKSGRSLAERLLVDD